MPGVLAFIGVGVNSVGGTAANSVAITNYIPILRETLQVERTPLAQETLQGRFDRGQEFDGLMNARGGFETDLHPIAAGFGLRAVFDTTTAITSYAIDGAAFVTSHTGVRAHVFKATQEIFQSGSGSDLPTLTVAAYRGEGGAGVGEAQVFYGMTGQSMEFSIEAGQLAKMNFEFLGRDFGSIARPTEAFPAAAAFAWSQASVSLGGTALGILEQIAIRLENPMEQVAFVDGTQRPAMTKRTGFRDVNISGRMQFVNNSEYQRFTTGSQYNLTLTFQGPQISTAPTNNARVAVIVPAFRYRSFPLNAGGPGRVSVDFTGRGVFHEGSATSIEVTLVNTRTADYRTNT